MGRTVPSAPAAAGLGGGAPALPGPAGRTGDADGHPLLVRRRRSLSLLLVGGLVVAGCALGAVVLVERIGQHRPVLAVANPVPVGQVITAGDVRTVRLSVEPGVDVVSASAAGEVVGRPAAVPLRVGMVVSRSVVGPAQLPGDRQAVVAVAVAAGQFPPGLAAGARVEVHTAPDAGADIASVAGPVVAVVLGAVEVRDVTVVSLLVPRDEAGAVAVTPPEAVRLVLVGGEG